MLETSNAPRLNPTSKGGEPPKFENIYLQYVQSSSSESALET